MREQLEAGEGVTAKARAGAQRHTGSRVAPARTGSEKRSSSPARVEFDLSGHDAAPSGGVPSYDRLEVETEMEVFEPELVEEYETARSMASDHVHDKTERRHDKMTPNAKQSISETAGPSLRPHELLRVTVTC